MSASEWKVFETNQASATGVCKKAKKADKEKIEIDSKTTTEVEEPSAKLNVIAGETPKETAAKRAKKISEKAAGKTVVEDEAEEEAKALDVSMDTSMLI